MYLMYYTNEKGDRTYTLQVGIPHLVPSGPADAAPSGRRSLGNATPAPSRREHARPPLPCPPQKHAPDGSATHSAHPARFSPDDKFSRERVTTKKRFGLLPTQGPVHEY